MVFNRELAERLVPCFFCSYSFETARETFGSRFPYDWNKSINFVGVLTIY